MYDLGGMSAGVTTSDCRGSVKEPSLLGVGKTAHTSRVGTAYGEITMLLFSVGSKSHAVYLVGSQAEPLQPVVHRGESEVRGEPGVVFHCIEQVGPFLAPTFD